MTLETTATRFLKAHLSKKSYSRKTKVAYRSDIDQFVNFVGKKTDIADALTPQSITGWITQLKRSGHKHSTIRRSLVTLNLLSDYSLNAGHIEESPFWRLNLKTPNKRPRKVRDFAEVVRTLRTTSQQAFHRINLTHSISRHAAPKKHELQRRRRLRLLRDLVIVELLSTIGMRPAELSSLTIYDLRSHITQLRITDANRTRTIPLTGTYQRELLKKYLRERRTAGALSSALLLNHQNESLSTQGIQNALNKLTRINNVRVKITPRLLRQTLERQMLAAQVNPSVISYVLNKQFLVGRRASPLSFSTPTLTLELAKLSN